MGDRPARQPSSRLSLSFATAANLLLALTTVSISPIYAHLQAELSLSYSGVGMLTTAFFLGYALGQIPSGLLTDRVGPRRVLPPSLAAAGVSSAAFAMASDFHVLLALRFLSGGAAAGVFIPGIQSVMRGFAASHRGAAVAVFAASWSLGIVIGAPLSAALAFTAGWRAAVALLALASILAAALLWAVPAWEAPPTRGRRSTSLQLELIKSGHLWALGFAQFCRLGTIFTLVAWIPIFLSENRGFDLVSASLLLSAFQLLAVAVNPLGGVLSDRVGRWAVLIASFAGLGPALFLFGTVGSPLALWGLAALLSVLYYAPSSPLLAILPEKFGLERAGAVAGYQNTLGASGALLLPLVLGIAKDTFGSFEAGWATLASLLSASTLVLVLAFKAGRKGA